MREQSRLLRSLRAEAEPGGGFYARVMERIEAQGVVSIWNLFFDSIAGRALAMASMILVLCLSAYMVSSESSVELPKGQAVLQGSGGLLTGSPDRDSVLANLVTYREQ